MGRFFSEKYIARQ